MGDEDARTDYKLMQRLFNILGIEYKDKEEEEYKAITIESEMDISVMFVFDKNGVYKYMG